MDCNIGYAPLGEGDWGALWEDLDPRGAHSPASKPSLLKSLLDSFHDAGAVHFIEEAAYIDRDYSAAYSAYYSALYRNRSKYCRRVHFFSSDLENVWKAPDRKAMADELASAGAAGCYLGYIVLRPIPHAPVSRALLSSAHVIKPGDEISVRSKYTIHLLGAELEIEGAPVTEQDSITGACAQAAIWAAGRHIHNQHSMPWFSTIDITNAAVTPTDSILAKSLPLGGEALNGDNMVRALRAMGEHPVVYNPEEEGADWDFPAHLSATQYLDSGIPVLIGFKTTEKLGHAVVAVGTVTDGLQPFGQTDLNVADRVTHLLINDDQRGIYQRLPLEHETGCKLSLKDALFLIVPLPAKVSLKAEFAAITARDKISDVLQDTKKYLRKVIPARAANKWAVDREFYATAPEHLVARTYLTRGWKYKHRLLRNSVPEELKTAVSETHLPRYVWVTEFSLEEDLKDLDPCKRRVRAHVVIDATSSRFDDENVLIVHAPGLIVMESFAASQPEQSFTTVHVLPTDMPYYPRVKGWYDYYECLVQ